MKNETTKFEIGDFVRLKTKIRRKDLPDFHKDKVKIWNETLDKLKKQHGLSFYEISEIINVNGNSAHPQALVIGEKIQLSGIFFRKKIN